MFSSPGCVCAQQGELQGKDVMEEASVVISLDDDDEDELRAPVEATPADSKAASVLSHARKRPRSDGTAPDGPGAASTAHHTSGSGSGAASSSAVPTRRTVAAAASSSTNPIELDDDSDDDALEVGMAGGGVSSAPATSSASSLPPMHAAVMIDLCDEDEDEEGGAFAKQLNLLFDDEIQIVGERRNARAASGKAPLASTGSPVDAIDLLEDCDGEDGSGVGSGSPDEDADARMARRMQAQLDADASAEEARDASDFSKDEEVARRLQERLAREMAAERDGELSDAAVGDVLRAQRNQIRGWLVKNAAQLSVLDVWSNPAAQPGGALYAKFAAAHAAARDKSVRLVFHGTRDENIAKICANGLDPSFRGKNGQALGKGEYFAENVNISIPYCAGGKRMIVFAVLMDESGLTKRQNSIVVVNRTEHQLPMFVISFEMKAGGHSAWAQMALPGGLGGGIGGSAAAALMSQIRAGGGGSAAALAQLRSMFGIAPIGAMPLPVPPPRGRGKARAPAAGRQRR